MMTSKLNGDYTDILRQNKRIDNKYHKAFKKSSKVGDTGCLSMQNKDRMLCLQTRLLRPKYNSGSFDYIKNVLWDIRMEDWYD